MPRKPFPWNRLTPAQLDLMERLASAGVLAYSSLNYRDLMAFEELRKLRLADMRPNGRSGLEAILTDKGTSLRDAGYGTEQILVRVTGPQVDLLRYLNDAPHGDDVGKPLREIRGMALDVCRRMSLRGWVEWYGRRNGEQWARLTVGGKEVLAAIDELDEAIAQMAEAMRAGRLN